MEAALQGVDNKEVISTEEMLGHVDKLNKAWEDQGKQFEEDELLVGRLDPEALYLSLNTKLCGKECEN